MSGGERGPRPFSATRGTLPPYSFSRCAWEARRPDRPGGRARRRSDGTRSHSSTALPIRRPRGGPDDSLGPICSLTGPRRQRRNRTARSDSGVTMSRVPPTASSVRTARRKTVGLAFTGAMLVILLATGVAQAVAVTVGYRDFAYDPGQASRATSDTQQSKLWFAGGIWYGGFYSTADEQFNIWRLDSNAGVQTWADTGILVDTRDRVHPDFLFDARQQALGRLDQGPVHLDHQRLQRRHPGPPVHLRPPPTRSRPGSRSTPASRRRSSAASTTTSRPRRVARRP